MKKMIITIIFLCLCLTACGQKQEEILQEDGQKGEIIPRETEAETDTDREINWIIEEQELPDADEAIMDVISPDSIIWFDDWYLRDGTVYRVVTCTNRDETVPDSEFYKGWYIQKLADPYEEWDNYFIAPTDWVEGDVCKSLRSGSYIMTEDKFYVLLEGAQGNYIGEWTEEGGPSAKKIETDIFAEEFSGGSVDQWWRGQDGSYYLYGEDEYIYMDDGFNVKERLGSDDGYRFYSVQENPKSGRVYLFCAEESNYVAEYSSYVDIGVKILDQKEKKVLLEAAEMDGDYGEIVSFTSEEEGYCYGSYSIAGFSMKTGELESIYNFDDDKSYFDKMYNSKKPLTYMHIRNGIVDGNAKEDGSHVLLVACSDGAYRIWKMYQGEEQTSSSDKQKQKIELAVTIPGAFINQAVYEFNRQSDEYEAVLRTPDEGEDFEDFRTRIQAELAAGEGPDILMAGSVIDMEAGANKGFLTDLTDAFAGYETDVLPAAWESGMVNGCRYGVPYSCTINTLVTDKRLVDNRSCWTLEEAMQYMEESGAEYFIAGAGEAELFFDLGILTGTNGQLIDWQNKTSYLNKDAAVRLLEFSGRYADYECEAGSEFVETASGKAMTAILYVGSPVEMQVAAAMFKSNEAYIGFPTENGESGHVMAVSNLVINRKSPCPEGAMAFLEFLLSTEMQEDKAKELMEGSGYGFPVRKSAMDLVYDSLRGNKEMTGGAYGGIELEEWTLSDESIEKLKDMIETAMPKQEKADEVMDIVVEEIKSFRQEGKSAQQTLDIVNSRVQLYLNEIGD